MSTGRPSSPLHAVRPVTLLWTALVAFVATVLLVLGYPRLVSLGAASPMLAAVSWLGVGTGLVTASAPIAAVVLWIVR